MVPLRCLVHPRIKIFGKKTNNDEALYRHQGSFLAQVLGMDLHLIDLGRGRGQAADRADVFCAPSALISRVSMDIPISRARASPELTISNNDP